MSRIGAMGLAFHGARGQSADEVFASDDIDDASKGNIRNLKQTARELIKQEEGSVYHFFNDGG